MVSAKSYDAVCKSSQEEGIQWFCINCRISFNGVTKMTKKVNIIEQTRKEILVSVEEVKNKVSNVRSGVSIKEIEEMVREEFEEKQRIEERKFNVMCFGLEESSTLNAGMKKKEDETNVTNIMQEVLGDDEDFSTSISKMLRIGRPLLQENQDNPVDSSGGAAPVANDRNDHGTKKKRRPVRIIFTDADQKKKILAALRETINESRTGKYNIFSSSRI